MKVPKEIVECVKKYEKLRKKYEQIEKEMEECKQTFVEWEGETGVYIGHLFITDKAKGEHQGDGEYCDQYQLGEDWYTGFYYYPIEGSKKYVAYDYEC